MRAFPLFLLLCAHLAQAAILVVDTTSDASLTACTAAPGDCSLRGAIAAANSAAGLDTINFDIPMSDAGCVAATAVCTIATTSSGFVVFGGGAAVIDGTTQPGWQANTLAPTQGGLNTQLKIMVNGSACPGCNGLDLANAGSLVRGLAISGFRINVAVEAGDVVVEGNFLGTNVTGSAAQPTPNSQIGIFLSGNPNGGDGTFGNVRIGGVLPAQRNLVSGNAETGMQLTGFGIQVLGNLVGTNAAGTAAIANGDGVLAQGGSVPFSYFIGDGTAAGRNVVSGNNFKGIFFGGSFAGTHASRIQGNYIGTDVGGDTPLGNGQTGIEQHFTVLSGDTARAVEIGGLLDGQGNRIRFNGGAGILVPANRERTSILGNQFGGNALLGISLGAIAHLPNDLGDADGTSAGGNLAQNFPEISASSVIGSNVNLSYRVDSTTLASTYPLQVEFFKAEGDEGRDFLGGDVYSVAQSTKPIVLAVPAGVTLTANDVIVATATDANGNTSEFSFDTVALTIQPPEPSSCITPDTVFCNGFESTAPPPLLARVSALSTSGPFKPNGLVHVTDNRGGSCTLTLAPKPAALTSEGTCILFGSGAAGPISITATLDTFTSAFGSSTGGNVTTTANFTVP